MRRRLIFTIVAAETPSLFAAGLGVSDIGFMDGLKVDKTTHIATFLLIIDRPLEDGLTKPKVRNKLLAYHNWIYVEGKLEKYHPEANISAGVGILILHNPPKTSLGQLVLNQIVSYATELKFKPTTKLLPTKN